MISGKTNKYEGPTKNPPPEGYSSYVITNQKKSFALCRSMDYIHVMDFEWDLEKSNRCYLERGFDFAYAARAFFDPDRIVIKDNRYDYGEPRYQMIGKIQERVFVVIFTPRSNAIRIISARKANQREVKQYENTSHDN